MSYILLYASNILLYIELNCVSGFWCQVPDKPRNNLNEHGQQSPTIFKPYLGSHCNANIVVRSDHIAIQFLVSFLRRHVGFNQFVFHHLSKLCQPHNQI